jgi:hypothetical protein
MFWREMRVSHDHLERYMPEQFFDGAPIHSSHYESTGKGAAVAMPGISLNFRFLQSGWKPSARSSQCIPRSGRWENRGRSNEGAFAPHLFQRRQSRRLRSTSPSGSVSL